MFTRVYIDDGAELRDVAVFRVVDLSHNLLPLALHLRGTCRKRPAPPPNSLQGDFSLACANNESPHLYRVLDLLCLSRVSLL